MEANFIETYNEWDIYQNDNGDFLISGVWEGEKTTIYEDTIEDIKLIIDYLEGG